MIKKAQLSLRLRWAKKDRFKFTSPYCLEKMFAWRRKRITCPYFIRTEDLFILLNQWFYFKWRHNIITSLVEIGSVILEKMIFQNSSMYFHYFVIFPYEKGRTLYLLNLNPFIQGWFVKRVVGIGAVVLDKKIVKIYQFIFAISLRSLLG